ncbi:LCP family protein [Jongsikchunia kroppenstedtii]|uniref:LCP family protein n=1 Tax=Jongsikchunia kroppenstedtii TaxID=1121721 RepID=UPI0003A48E4A|nr:LCP family protein [Jongsikchunia kroppenstedtii]
MSDGDERDEIRPPHPGDLVEPGDGLRRSLSGRAESGRRRSVREILGEIESAPEPPPVAPEPPPAAPVAPGAPQGPVPESDNEQTREIPRVTVDPVDGPISPPAGPPPADQPTTAAPATPTAPATPATPTTPRTRAAATSSRTGRPLPQRIAAAVGNADGSVLATQGVRVAIALATVFAIICTGYVWWEVVRADGRWHNVSAIDTNDANIRNRDGQGGDENYLIVGTDTRTGQNGRVGAGTTADAEGARSDTVILVNIPADRSRVVAVSFPRDLQIDRPDCDSWNNETETYTDEIVPAETNAKLNTAYGDGGPKCAVKVIQKISGLKINHFIGMDFYGFEQVVNKIGGVEVCSPTPLYDYELGNILKRAGRQHVTGKQALNYVRARKIETEGNGDYGRIKRQQLFLSAMLRGALSNKVFTNPSKMTSILNTFIKNSVVDNVKLDDLMELANSMQGLDAGRVSFLTVPTSGTAEDGSGNEIPRTDDIDAIFNAIIDDKPLPGEAGEKKKQNGRQNASSSAAPAPAPSTPAGPPITAAVTSVGAPNIGVRVLNGTGTQGLAQSVQDSLENEGFEVRGVADASQHHDTTVVRYGPGEQQSAATLASMFPGAAIQPDHTVKSGVEIIVGNDYSGSVGSVPARGTQLTVTQLPETSTSESLPNDLQITNAGDTSCD